MGAGKIPAIAGSRGCARQSPSNFFVRVDYPGDFLGQGEP